MSLCGVAGHLNVFLFFRLLHEPPMTSVWVAHGMLQNKGMQCRRNDEKQSLIPTVQRYRFDSDFHSQKFGNRIYRFLLIFAPAITTKACDNPTQWRRLHIASLFATSVPQLSDVFFDVLKELTALSQRVPIRRQTMARRTPRRQTAFGRRLRS